MLDGDTPYCSPSSATDIPSKKFFSRISALMALVTLEEEDFLLFLNGIEFSIEVDVWTLTLKPFGASFGSM